MIEQFSTEEQKVINTISKYIDLSVTPYQSKLRSVIKVDKRDPMYGGDGIVYLLQMFEEGELVNNRIGAYMVFLNKGDQAGFHSHGGRNEQEVYVVMHGQGEYSEKKGKNGDTRKQKIVKGSITTIQQDGFHSVKSISEEPLIVFVITTYSPE